MTKLVREYLEVADHTSLDEMIEMLVSLRETLPAGSQPELRMRGDDVFGRRLSICYLRAQSGEEAELEARYGAAGPALRDVASYERIAGEISLAA